MPVIDPPIQPLPTAASEEAQVASDATTLAATDLTTLQAFQAEIQTGTVTLAQFLADLAALQQSLGDPGRQSTAGSILSAWQQSVSGAIDTMVSEANAAAGN